MEHLGSTFKHFFQIEETTQASLSSITEEYHSPSLPALDPTCLTIHIGAGEGSTFGAGEEQEEEEEEEDGSTTASKFFNKPRDDSDRCGGGGGGSGGNAFDEDILGLQL